MRNSLLYESPTSPHKVEKNAWGWLPKLALFQSVGLLFMSWAFVEARAFSPSSELFFWIALAALILPAAFRLASAEPIRSERIGIILLLGMSLYLVKVMHSPVTFTFPDELSHLRNVNEILETHRLFQENPVQPVTALYPGLPTVTSTLVSLSGISTFTAGILVIGAARLILFLALFLLYEQVSGSAHIAGLGVLIYMANPNFLYWTAEYAYEPLALPMVTLVLIAVARRETTTDGRHRLAWTVVALLGLLTVIITHHMSSYILTALLCALCIFSVIRSRGKQWGPWDLALIALSVTSLWLIYVASLTFDYLSPVLRDAISSVLNMIAQEETGRDLFTSTSTGRVAPLWEQITGIGSVALIVLGLPFGILTIGKSYRDKIFAALLVALAMLYFPVQLMRLTKEAWETANRSSEFLFLGIAFVLAIGILNFWFSRWSGWTSQATFAVLFLVVFFGGLITGWPPKARLPRPFLVSANNGYVVQPQIVSVAEWMATYLGNDNRLATSRADAKVLGAYGQYPFTGSAGGIQNMLLSPGVGASERSTLSKRGIEYIVADRKQVSWDHLIGFYFINQQYSPSWELELIDPLILGKFERLPLVTRMLDTGDIAVYDIAMLLSSSAEETETNENQPSAATPQPSLATGQTYSPMSTSAPKCGWYLSLPKEWSLLFVPLVLFLPGLALTAVLFPVGTMTISERLLVSIGLSISFTALSGLILSGTSCGLQAKTIWLTLFGLALGTIVILVRLVRRGEARRPSLNFNFKISHWVLLAFTALITIMAIGIARTPAPQNGLQGYTVLSVQAADAPDSIRLGVESEEFKETKYQIKYEINGVVIKGPTLQLQPGENREYVILLPTDKLADQAFIVLLLRLDNPTKVYRHVVWWPETYEAKGLGQ